MQRLLTIRVSGWGSMAQEFFVLMTLQGIHPIAKQNCFYNCLKKNHLSSSGEFELHFKNKHIFLEITSHCAAKVGIPLLILLPQPSKCQGYKCVLPYLVSSWRIRFCLVFLAQTMAHKQSPRLASRWKMP